MWVRKWVNGVLYELTTFVANLPKSYSSLKSLYNSEMMGYLLSSPFFFEISAKKILTAIIPSRVT
jgi:hypothetical protein